MDNTKVRLDKYLWAIRLFKTRSQAGNAIDGGKAKIMAATELTTLKAAHIVKPGERYQVYSGGKKWLIEVITVLDKRMKATEVAPYFKDLTPPEEVARVKEKSAFYFSTGGKKGNSSGRPTKKDRRMMDKKG